MLRASLLPIVCCLLSVAWLNNSHAAQKANGAWQVLPDEDAPPICPERMHTNHSMQSRRPQQSA